MSALQGYTGGYPYLRIARHYGLDYGDVLNYASSWVKWDAWAQTYWERQSTRNIRDHQQGAAITLEIKGAASRRVISVGAPYV